MLLKSQQSVGAGGLVLGKHLRTGLAALEEQCGHEEEGDGGKEAVCSAKASPKGLVH